MPLSPSLLALINNQEGLLTRGQGLDFMTSSQLMHLLRTKWQIALPGVYATFTGRLSDRQRLRAALLYGGDPAQITDLWALKRYGLAHMPAPTTVGLLIDASVKRATREWVWVRRTHRLPPPVILDGLPHAPLNRALIDFTALSGDRRTGIAVMSEAVQRQLVAVDRLVREAKHVTGRGAAVTNKVIADIVLGMRSAPEFDFLEICRALPNLPLPLFNALLELPGGTRVSPDALAVDSAAVHEANGRRAHFDIAPGEREDLFESMQARHDVMTVSGLAVLHDSPRQIRDEGPRVSTQWASLVTSRAGMGLPSGVVLLRPGPPGTPWLPGAHDGRRSA